MEEITTTIWDFGSQIFTNGLLYFTIKSAITLVITAMINRFINKAFKKTIEINDDQAVSLNFLSKLIRFVLYVIAIFTILNDVKLLSGLSTALLGATSVISVVVGLAAQETFGNFIAGFFLAMYHPFNVGDSVMLKEKNISGVVQEITFRHTVLTTIENTKLIVPNSVMNTAILENRIFGQSYYTQYVKFEIAYESDVNKAINIIQEDAQKLEEFIDIRTPEQKRNHDPIFNVRVDDFNASGVLLNFPIYTKDLPSSMLAASDLRKMLLEDFKKNDIEIPYQKIDIKQR